MSGRLPMSKSISSAKPWRKSNHSQQGQDEDQCPEFWLQFKVRAHRRLLSSHPCSWTCSRLLSVSDSLLESGCGACVALGHTAAGAARRRTPELQSARTSWWLDPQVGKRAREASSWGPWPTWTMERTNVLTCKLRSQARARSRREGEKKYSFFFSPGTILACVWNRPGAFECFRGVHLPTNPFFPPGVTDRSLRSSTSPYCHDDFHGTRACLPLVPLPIWY